MFENALSYYVFYFFNLRVKGSRLNGGKGVEGPESFPQRHVLYLTPNQT